MGEDRKEEDSEKDSEKESAAEWPWTEIKKSEHADKDTETSINIQGNGKMEKQIDGEENGR